MTNLNPCMTFPQSGKCIYLPFPDLAKPVPGGWTVSVSLKATTTPVPTDIMVQQGGKVLASMRITPTTSYATYNLSLSDADIAKGTTGLCHISGPLVVICETTPSGCCPNDVPLTIQASVSGTIVACDYGSTGGGIPGGITGWSGFGTILGYAGTQVQIWCALDGIQWICFLTFPGSPPCISIPSFGTATFSCSPLDISFPSHFPTDCHGATQTISVEVTA